MQLEISREALLRPLQLVSGALGGRPTLPILGNVLKKTGGRLKWYLLEVIPLFLLGTFIMFALDKLGALPAIIRAGEPLVSGWLGLLMIVPMVNLIALYVLAFSDWPMAKRVGQPDHGAIGPDPQ